MLKDYVNYAFFFFEKKVTYSIWDNRSILITSQMITWCCLELEGVMIKSSTKHSLDHNYIVYTDIWEIALFLIKFKRYTRAKATKLTKNNRNNNRSRSSLYMKMKKEWGKKARDTFRARKHDGLFLLIWISMVSWVGSSGNISLWRHIMLSSNDFGRSSATIYSNQLLMKRRKILFSIY